MGYDNLFNHFKTNFALMQHHKYSLYDLENMIPWERYIYISLLKAHIAQVEQQMRDQASIKQNKRN
jgi:hypothetical protein